MVRLLRREPRHADEEHVARAEAEARAQRAALVARLGEGTGIESVVDPDQLLAPDAAVFGHEGADVVGEHDRARGAVAQPAVDPAHQPVPQHLLVVVLAGDESRARARAERAGRDRHVGLEQVRVHDVGAAREPRETQREEETEGQALDPFGAGRAELGRQRAVALEVGQHDLVTERALAAHLGQQVLLGATHVERGDHVQDPHASSR